MSCFHKLCRRIGHRGAFLALVGLAFIFYGIGLIIEPVSYHHTDFFVDFSYWPYVFITSGVTTFFTGVAKWRLAAFGFGIAATISTWWAIRWLHVWIAENGRAGWPTAYTWVFISLMILLVSSWPGEYSRRRKG